MKVLKFLLFTCGSLAWGQYLLVPIHPEIPDSQVIAVLQSDGAKVTMGQFRNWVAANPPQIQQQIAQDPTVFLKQFAVMRRLADAAREKKLDQQGPTKDMLYYSITSFLGQAMIRDAYQNVEVAPDEIVSEYEATKAQKYVQVKVDAIYIAFGDPSTAAPDKKVLTEEQAKQKAVKLLSEINAGADFAKLAKENSDDEASRDKGGYLDTLTPGDNIPEGFQVVFKMKAGETSAPIRQPNGYYLLHAETVDFRPLKDVRDKVFNDLKDKHLNEWMGKMSHESDVDFPNPAFQPKTPAPASASGHK